MTEVMTTAANALISDAFAHRGELITRARRELGPWGDAAEDMVQDAYIHLIERIEVGEAPRSHRAWLHAVVRSRCAEERWRRARERASDLDQAPSRAPGPDEAAVAAAEARWCLAQVAALPANERDAIVGQVAGLSGAKAGEGYRSANAVYQALHRGRRRLRQARDAAWSILLPVPLRLWMSRARPTLPLDSPRGVLGGLGGLGGAVTVAGISVLGLAGGVHLASAAQRWPDPSPLVRRAAHTAGGEAGLRADAASRRPTSTSQPAPVEQGAPPGTNSAASASASPMQSSVGALSVQAPSGANRTALPFETTTDPAAASPDPDATDETGSSSNAPEEAGAQDARDDDPATANGPTDIPPPGGGTESSGTSAAGAGAQDAPVPDPAAVGQADASSSVTTPSGTESSGTSTAGPGAPDAPVPDPATVGQADASSSMTPPSGP